MKTLIYIILGSVLLSACSKSVLSDVEISDPHLLKVKVKIEQNRYDEKEVQVFIRDKSNHPIELMTGRVIVNGHRVRFERAYVHSTGARGYIYTPHDYEDVFKITIYWNSYEHHSFILSPANGWPGFIAHDHCDCYGSEPIFLTERYSLRPAPFHDHEIDVSYNIIEHWHD